MAGMRIFAMPWMRATVDAARAIPCPIAALYSIAMRAWRPTTSWWANCPVTSAAMEGDASMHHLLIVVVVSIVR